MFLIHFDLIVNVKQLAEACELYPAVVCEALVCKLWDVVPTCCYGGECRRGSWMRLFGGVFWDRLKLPHSCTVQVVNRRRVCTCVCMCVRVRVYVCVRKNWVPASIPSSPPPLVQRPRGVPLGIWTLIMPLLKEKSVPLKCLRHDRFSFFSFSFQCSTPTLSLFSRPISSSNYR